MTAKYASLFTVLTFTAALSTANAADPPSFGAPTPQDEGAFNQCLADAKDQPMTCLGRVQNPCLGTENGQTTMGAVLCANRERALWTSRTDAATLALRKEIRREQTPFFDAAEQAWTAYRDKTCAYEASIYLGGSLARVIGADCLLRETAQRAVYLEGELYRVTHENE